MKSLKGKTTVETTVNFKILPVNAIKGYGTNNYTNNKSSIRVNFIIPHFTMTGIQVETVRTRNLSMDRKDI